MSTPVLDNHSKKPNRAALAALTLAMPVLLAPGWLAITARAGLTQPIGTLCGLTLSILLIACTFTDAAWGKIYNAVTYPAMLWALVINLVPSGTTSLPGLNIPLGAVGFGACLLGGFTCFVLMVISFLTAGGGGGDVKLATAIGLLLGMERGIMAVVYTYLAAAAFSLVYVLALGAFGAAAWAVSSRLGVVLVPLWLEPPTPEKRNLLRKKIRMGPFFAIGTLIALLEGGLL